MRVLVVAGQKGGCGKSTLSGHLAVQAERAGHGPVVLMDADPQGSLGAWWNERKADSPAMAALGEDLPGQLKELERSGVKLVVIDTPPSITNEIRPFLAAADLILLPVRPSPHDLRSVAGTLALAEEAKHKFLFVVNGAAARAHTTAQTVAALSQYGPVAPTIIFQRTDFGSSMVDGRTVMELSPTSKSAKEIEDLWAYINKALNNEVIK